MIVNDVYLFHVSYDELLQLFHLVWEKEVVFVLRSRQIVVKIDGVNKNRNRLERQGKKVLTEFTVLNILDEIKIKLIERCLFKVNESVYTARWSH